MTVTLTFPLPKPGLRPNSMAPRQVKWGLTKQAREMAKRTAFVEFQKIDCEMWVLKGYTFRAFFATKRHWDADNLVASGKALTDGIADACGQNDRNFELTKVERYTDTKAPRLEIVIEVEELV